eukprot:102066-Pyramimonas_sp.AAC.1
MRLARGVGSCRSLAAVRGGGGRRSSRGAEAVPRAPLGSGRVVSCLAGYWTPSGTGFLRFCSHHSHQPIREQCAGELLGGWT